MSKSITRFSFLRRGLPGLGALLLPLLGWGQSFTPGNLVVVSVGNGTTALSANAAPISLKEYSTSGTVLNTYALPTAVNGSNRACTISGTNSAEGAVSLSGNGRYLLLGGYDAAVGTVNVATTSSTNPSSGLGYAKRVVARVAADGTSNTATNLSIYSTVYVQGVASVDGNSFWMCGGGVNNATGGVQYIPSLGATSSNEPVAFTTVNGTRVPAIFNNKLYVSASIANNVGVNSFAAAQPTGSSTPSLVLPAGNPYGFSIVPISPAVGDITAAAYVADFTAGIRKFVFNSSSNTWTAATPVALANATGVVALYNPATGSMQVYATTTMTAAAGGGSLYSATDSAPSSASSNIGTPALLATAPTNTVFRGLAFAPAPVPTISTISNTAPPPGTSVTITGTGFYNGTIPLSISFNGTPATSFTINSPTQITVTVPDGATNGNVTVTTQGGTTGIRAYPLPVELSRFTAEAAGPAAVRLAWATASEKNSARFEVERSPDGLTFTRVGEVAAAGSSPAARAYGYLDTAAPAGLLYYRLRQVDADGTASYSPVRPVTVAAAGLALTPNPTREARTLAQGLPAGAVVEVFDALGRSVLRTQADAAGQAPLALPAGQAPGLYVVHSGARTARLVLE